MAFERQTFEVSRELEYFSSDELEMQIGHGRDWWPVAILKELVDNALDACEMAGVAPRVEIIIDEDTLTVQDNGLGLPADTLEASLDYTKRVSDKVHYVSPTRGRIGNALKTAWAAPFVAGGKRAEFDVWVPGQRHRVTVELDRLRQAPALNHEVEDSDEVAQGTRFVIRWPDVACYLRDGQPPDSYNLWNSAKTATDLIEEYAACNPHAHFIIDGDEFLPTELDWKKWQPGDRTSAHWYTAEDLRDLIAAYIITPEYKADPKTVRAFVAEFAGLRGTAKQKAVTDDLSGTYLADLVDGNDIDMVAVEDLLIRMQENSRAPSARHGLGNIGEDHLTRWMVEAGAVEDSVKYCVRYGDGPIADVVEAAFGIYEDDDLARRIGSGLNWGAMLEPPFRELEGYFSGQRIDPHDPVILFVHVARPALAFTDRGKTRAALDDDLSERLGAVVRSVTSDWKDAKRNADREDRVQRRDLERMRQEEKPDKVTIKDACFEVMEEAFNHASDNGRHYANARQIMYAARPMVLEIAGKFVKNSSTFTQTYLKDYLEEMKPAWAARVVWDARGHLKEPHGGTRIGLGGIEVMDYRNAWTDGQFSTSPEYQPPVMVGTNGPSLRYQNVLFIEKEGFGPILQESRIAERFDLAIMSTKGMTVGAACEVLHHLGDDVRVFALHDFDVSGLNILNTLRTGTRLSRGREIIDLGFRLEDVEGLQSEPVEGKSDPSDRLHGYGATYEEIEFLVQLIYHDGNWRGERVELNAMTSGQFIDWLEGKLEAAGVEKVVPEGETLQRCYQRADHLQQIAEDIEWRDVHEDEEEAPEAADLERRVRAVLADEPTLSWDAAVWRVVERDRNG